MPAGLTRASARLLATAQTPYISNTEHTRIYGDNRASGSDGESLAQKLKEQTSGWQTWETVGGGKGYVARPWPIPIHYGDVEFTVAKFAYQQMTDQEGASSFFFAWIFSLERGAMT